MDELPTDVLKIILVYKKEFEQYELKKRTIESICSLLLDIQPLAVPYLKQCLFNLFDLSEPTKMIAMTHRLLGYFNNSTGLYPPGLPLFSFRV